MLPQQMADVFSSGSSSSSSDDNNNDDDDDDSDSDQDGADTSLECKLLLLTGWLLVVLLKHDYFIVLPSL